MLGDALVTSRGNLAEQTFHLSLAAGKSTHVSPFFLVGTSKIYKCCIYSFTTDSIAVIAILGFTINNWDRVEQASECINYSNMFLTMFVLI